MFFKTSLFLFVIFSSILLCFCETNRHIECVVYADTADSLKENELSVIHITATGDVDKIHYVWSTYVLPSVIISRTTKDTTLEKVDFEKLRSFQSGAVKFSKEPLASTGITISELWQNLYGSDTADINEISEVVPLNLEDFQWKNVTNNSISCSKEFGSINLVSSGDEVVFSKGGAFEIEFSVSGKEISAADYPHLIYSGNSTQLKIVFNKFYSNSSRVRYAVEGSVFAPLSSMSCDHDDECKTIVTKSISDEFSPGIFSDITLLPPCSQDSFLSWRPVAYTSKEPSVANSTDAKVTSKCSKSAVHKIRSIAELFFDDLGNSSASMFNMTFGTKGDGFYSKTEYTMWSFMAGVGSSVGFKLSATAIIFVVVGLGALTLFLITGLIFTAIQKCKKKDDELLLINSLN